MQAPMPILDSFLAAEVERTLYDFSFAWEGVHETVSDEGDVVIRTLPGLGPNLAGWLAPIIIDPARAGERLDELWSDYGERPFRWLIGPGSQPADLTERLLARGLSVLTEWDGLVLTDLQAEIPRNPDLMVEPLDERNAEEFAGLLGGQEEHLARARRCVAHSGKEARIYLSRLEGKVSGYTVLRLEPTGVAYLRQALTAPEYRGRHVYMSGVAHRLALAREAGCLAAVVQAVATTSSPILQKYGFRKVSWLRALGHAAGA